MTTDNDGIARITNLPPGDYWLYAEYLGIGAADHCFHINERPSGKAKRNLAYDWGDLAPATRHIAAGIGDGLTDAQDLIMILRRKFVVSYLVIRFSTVIKAS